MVDREIEVQPRYKVGKVVERYGLEDVHDSLPARWLGQDSDPVSLRDLADELNVAITRSAMSGAGLDPLEGEAENVYRLLTGEDVSVGVRTQQRNRLERAGVDVGQLESDFVTHQAVYTYLTKALEVSKDEDPVDPVEKHRDRIERLRNRLIVVTEDSLENLQRAEHISLGQHTVIADVQIYCRDCDSQLQFDDVVSEGGCNCE